MNHPPRKKVAPASCSACGEPSHCVDPQTGVGLCCWVIEAKGAAYRNVIDAGRFLGFIKAVANPHNWKAQNQAGKLVLWDAHPELHVTAKRLLESIQHPKRGEDSE